MIIQRQSGYTLFEIALVLVITSLLAGGVFFAKEIVSNAQSRALASQIEQLDAAINEFFTKYNCLPGDCSDGASLTLSDFEISDATPYNFDTHSKFYYFLNPISDAYAAGPGPESQPGASIGLDGDGDGTIDSQDEAFRAIYSVQLKNLLQGKFTSNNLLELSVPAIADSTDRQAGWAPIFVPTTVTSAYDGSVINGGTHYYKALASADGLTGNKNMNPDAARRLDGKIDDGTPRQGNMTASSTDTATTIKTAYAFAVGDVDTVGTSTTLCVKLVSSTYVYHDSASAGFNCSIMIKAQF